MKDRSLVEAIITEKKNNDAMAKNILVQKAQRDAIEQKKKDEEKAATEAMKKLSEDFQKQIDLQKKQHEEQKAQAAAELLKVQ